MRDKSGGVGMQMITADRRSSCPCFERQTSPPRKRQQTDTDTLTRTHTRPKHLDPEVTWIANSLPITHSDTEYDSYNSTLYVSYTAPRRTLSSRLRVAKISPLLPHLKKTMHIQNQTAG